MRENWRQKEAVQFRKGCTRKLGAGLMDFLRIRKESREKKKCRSCCCDANSRHTVVIIMMMKPGSGTGINEGFQTSWQTQRKNTLSSFPSDPSTNTGSELMPCVWDSRIRKRTFTQNKGIKCKKSKSQWETNCRQSNALSQHYFSSSSSKG